jgi:hypothetical protein
VIEENKRQILERSRKLEGTDWANSLFLELCSEGNPAEILTEHKP